MMDEYINLREHPRIVARMLRYGAEELRNVLISVTDDDRVEVTPFYCETHSTIYISRPLELSPHRQPLPLHMACLRVLP